MPRPASISDSYYADLRDRAVPYCEGFPEKLREEVNEALAAGIWLEDCLISEGYDSSIVEKAYMAHAQISAGRDPWTVAEILHKDAKLGQLVSPGSQLSDDLLYGRLDYHFGKEIEDTNLTLNESIQIVDAIREGAFKGSSSTEVLEDMKARLRNTLN